MKILLVNPPIYDFTAYDFWLKPYGMLTVAGMLRDKANFQLFDYLDRNHPFMAKQEKLKSDIFGTGPFHHQKIPKPKPLSNIPRYFRRFALPQKFFTDFLTNNPPCDFAMIQTTMTYWYPGVKEVIDDIRNYWPNTKIIIGGNYPTLCPDHAKTLNPDLIVKGSELNPLWQFLNLTPDTNQPALWEACVKLNVATLKITDGCPFKCTYCSVPKTYGRFKPRNQKRCLTELKLAVKQGATDIAFYDDALLFNADTVITPFLKEVLNQNIKVNFHCPNALNARFITKPLAQLMTAAGFKTFYLGFESASTDWQTRTGSKVHSDELARSVKHLTNAGADPKRITAYQILGHPFTDSQQLEHSMHFVNKLGIRGMLADYSPIPGTPDGEYCRKWIDLDEPLLHNKTAFPIILLGYKKINCLKALQKKLNQNLRIS